MRIKKPIESSEQMPQFSDALTARTAVQAVPERRAVLVKASGQVDLGLRVHSTHDRAQGVCVDVLPEHFWWGNGPLLCALHCFVHLLLDGLQQRITPLVSACMQALGNAASCRLARQQSKNRARNPSFSCACYHAVNTALVLSPQQTSNLSYG